VKFGVDKRRCHLSDLILNGELTRDEALKTLEEPLYRDGELERDKQFVMKKLGFCSEEFENYLRQPPVPHESFPSHARLANSLIGLRRRFLRKD